MGCREYTVSNDPSMRLEFSCNKICFDTVFTEQGSATAQMMVYNRNKNAVIVDRVWLTNSTAFKANVDGEADLARLTNLQINGGDSVFVFVRVDIDPNGKNSPVLVEDQLHFHLANGTTQAVALEAFGQDVTRIGRAGCKRTERTSMTFTADKPYLVFDTLVVNGTLKINAGTTIYMHSGACIYALGNVSANGKPTQPIVIRGDRLDYLFENVPYLYAGGSWDGLYLQAEKKQTYEFDFVDILSGNVGLHCTGFGSTMPSLKMNGCRIHNHSQYGLILLRTNALVTNTEISNCASYCVYCSGGKQRFYHTTVASYFGSTNVRIQSAVKENTSAVYIDNLNKRDTTNTSFYNSIITGYQTQQLLIATPFENYYTGSFVGNYLKSDELAIPNAKNNTYWSKNESDPVFQNTYFRYLEYTYYDFRLDSLSAARHAGDSIHTLPGYTETAIKDAVETDRNGVSRIGTKPDAGCYQYK